MIIGLVGKPSAGKSSFFKASTLADVDIANYPFTTLKANSAIGYVNIDCVDQHFGKQCNPRTGFCKNHKRFIPVQMIDVPGLVPGAHEGHGMGSQFLDELRQADVLIHVIDISGSTNEKGEAVDALSYDPCNDVAFLESEIDLWYLDILKKGWEKSVKQMMQCKENTIKYIAKQLSGLGVKEEHVEDSVKQLNMNIENPQSWTLEQLLEFAKLLRHKTKPIVIAANKIDIPGSEKNLERLKQKHPDLTIVACSAESEIALKSATTAGAIDYVPGETDFKIVKDINNAQKKALDFIKQNVLDKFGSTGLQKVLNTVVFDVLKYIAVYPGGVNKLEDQYGNVLPDCFLMPPNSTALDFAFKIHSDIGNNFIKAIDVKTRKVIGKEHILKTGDVVEICTSK